LSPGEGEREREREAIRGGIDPHAAETAHLFAPAFNFGTFFSNG